MSIYFDIKSSARTNTLTQVHHTHTHMLYELIQSDSRRAKQKAKTCNSRWIVHQKRAANVQCSSYTKCFSALLLVVRGLTRCSTLQNAIIRFVCVDATIIIIFVKNNFHIYYLYFMFTYVEKIMNYFFAFDALTFDFVLHTHATVFRTSLPICSPRLLSLSISRSLFVCVCLCKLVGFVLSIFHFHCFWLCICAFSLLLFDAVCSIVDFVCFLSLYTAWFSLSLFFSRANSIYFIDFDIWTTTDINNLLFN